METSLVPRCDLSPVDSPKFNGPNHSGQCPARRTSRQFGGGTGVAPGPPRRDGAPAGQARPSVGRRVVAGLLSWAIAWSQGTAGNMARATEPGSPPVLTGLDPPGVTPGETAE